MCICDFCDAEISKNDEFCPYCGCKVAKPFNTVEEYVKPLNDEVSVNDRNKYSNEGFRIEYDGTLSSYTGNNPIVVIPPVVKAISSVAFRLTRSIIKEVHIPEGVTLIKKDTFYDFKNLSLVSLPASLQQVEKGAFNGSNVYQLRLPRYDQTIYEKIVVNCMSQESNFICLYYYKDLASEFTYEDGGYYYVGLQGIDAVAIPLYNTIMKHSNMDLRKQQVDQCREEVFKTLHKAEYERQKFNSLYDVVDGCLLKYKGPDLYIELPKEITSIGDSAFRNFKKIKAISFQSPIKSIGKEAFYGCTALKSISFKEGLESIGENAFYNCKGLVLTSLPTTVRSIGTRAFSGCQAFTSFTLPNNIETFGEYIFAGCTKLREIHLPDSLDAIASGMFYNCALTSIELPSSLTAIGDYAFNENQLKEVIIPDSVRSIGEYAFSYNKTLEKITLPKDLTEIPNGLLQYCEKLPYIDLPLNIKSIGMNAFSYCCALRVLELPPYVEEMKKGCFNHCITIMKVILPSSLKKIPAECFLTDTNLDTVVIPNSVEEIELDAFKNCGNIKHVYVSKERKYNNLPKGLFVVKKYNLKDYDKVIQKVK